MEIHRVIIHQLFKQLGPGAKLTKTKFLLDTSNNDIIELIEELNKRYRKKNEKMGVFDTQNPTKFHSTFNAFFNDKTDDKFIEFSQDSSENLKDRIQGIGSAKGGYLVFAHYFDYREYCSIFFVRDTTGKVFKRNNTIDRFDIGKVDHIDIEHLAMACRINIEHYNGINKKYLSFIHNKSEILSNYFIDWISTTETMSSEEDTKLLLKVLRTIPMINNPETNSPFDRDEIIRSAHKHINANPTRTINLSVLSRNIFCDENYLLDYIYKTYPDIPTEFKAHSGILKQFIKVFAKADNIELIFYPSAYKDGFIRIDENNSSQIIINSPELAQQVKNSINE